MEPLARRDGEPFEPFQNYVNVMMPLAQLAMQFVLPFGKRAIHDDVTEVLLQLDTLRPHLSKWIFIGTCFM
jgi:hypothetical protein